MSGVKGGGNCRVAEKISRFKPNRLPGLSTAGGDTAEKCGETITLKRPE